MNKERRIGTAFHESFALNIPAIATVLRVCDEHDGELSADTILAETTLGANYVDAMPNYARGIGFLEVGTLNLTPLAREVLRKDPNLTRKETLWLMHYHLSAPHGPGPAFWNHLVTTALRIGQSVRRAEVSASIGSYLETTSQTVLASRTLDSTATVFLGTYHKSDALGRLGLLEAAEEAKGVYEVKQPDIPPVSTLAYALGDYWEGQANGASELLLKDLGNQRGFAGIFCLGPGMLGTLLSELQSAGILAIKRDAPPFVVTKLWGTLDELRERIYA